MEGVILAPRGSRAWPSEGWAWRDTRELAAGSPGCPAHGQEQSGPGRDQARGSLRGGVPHRPRLWLRLQGGQPSGGDLPPGVIVSPKRMLDFSPQG